MIKKKIFIISMAFMIMFATSGHALIIDDEFVGGRVLDNDLWAGEIIDDEINFWDSREFIANIEVTIWSPQNTTYCGSSVWFNVSTSTDSVNCTYELNGYPNVTMSQLNTTWYSDFDWVWSPNCINNVTAYCTNTLGYTNSSSTVYFWSCGGMRLEADRVLW